MAGKDCKKRTYLILLIMVCTQLISIIYFFQVKKEGFHSDEIWSYGFANSYDSQQVFMDSDGNLTNMNTWCDTKFLNDYIVVNEGEQFKYGAVYNNHRNDLSPPLHSILLHTISSFFPNVFSGWFAFGINLVSFLVAIVYLYKFAAVLKNDNFALCCCAVYGFSVGARDTFIYLRMYAMCTALIMVILYNLLVFLMKYKDNHKLINLNLVTVCIISLFAFMTHYYLIAMVGILTFLVCVISFVKKQYKLTFGFGICMSIMLVLSYIVFPTMLQIFNGRIKTGADVMDYNFKTRFIIILHYILKKLFNISLSVYSSGNFRIITGVCFFSFLVSLPILVVARNTKIFRKIFRYIKMIIFHPFDILRYLQRRINWMFVILIGVIIGQIIVVGETSSVYGMGYTIDRYISYVLPIAVVVVLGFVFSLLEILLKKRKYIQILFVGICIFFVAININNSMKDSTYFFSRHSDVKLEQIIDGKKCIYIRNFSWMLTTMAPTLRHADEIAQVQYVDYKYIEQLYKERMQEDIIVVIDTSFVDNWDDSLKDTNISYEVINNEKQEEKKDIYGEIMCFLEDLDKDTQMEHLSTEVFFTREMEVYLINP